MNDPLAIAILAVRHYSETHPRPSHVTQRQAGEMLGKSAPTITRLVRAGKLTLNGVGMIPISQIDALLDAKPPRDYAENSPTSAEDRAAA